jgi:hypothetical protein
VVSLPCFAPFLLSPVHVPDSCLVVLLFGYDSLEYNNMQRDHALAVLEGTTRQRNDLLEFVSLTSRRW